MNDLLMVYGRIIHQICPTSVEQFARRFCDGLSQALPMLEEKALNNHRTENVSSLLGMVFEKADRVYSTERTDRLLTDGDQPAFFKDWCFKLEFPNGMDKPQTLRERRDKGIRLRPCCFIVSFLEILYREQKTGASISEIGYYILNSEDVLCGNVSPEEVVKKIVSDRSRKIMREVQGDNQSQAMQHIRELLTYMEFANLIVVKSRTVTLNYAEKSSIAAFIDEDYRKLIFDVYKYNLDEPDEVKALQLEWREYMGRVAFRDKAVFETPAIALFKPLPNEIVGNDTTAIGNEGERIVFQMERKRIADWDDRYVDRVKLVGTTKGLGYDVHSISASGNSPRDAIYIEVKTTKRVTAPQIIDDSVELTRNEWDCAEQHKQNFWIYRVYLTNEGIFVFKIQDPFKAFSAGSGDSIRATAIRYRIDFRSTLDKLEKVS